MDFMKILKSLEEFLYEVITWLVFYPRTMWLAVRHPWRMMDYADSELLDRASEQYTDTLSPPLFLVITLIISHALELAVIGQSNLVTDTTGLSGLISDDANLVIFRAVAFSIFPLMMALRLLRRQKRKLDRNSLRPPFYSQCYVTAPLALAMGVAGLMVQEPEPRMKVAGAALLLAIMIWYIVLQTGWFAQHLKVNRLRALPTALNAYAQALVILVLTGALFA
jgi:hypothetical protein